MSIKLTLPTLSSTLSYQRIVTSTILAVCTVEPVGESLQRSLLLQKQIRQGLLSTDTGNLESATGSPTRKGHRDPNDDDGPSSPSGTRDRGTKRVVKISEDDLQVDWYDMLKLPNAEGSSDEQVRSAYRRRCLETHPDKQPGKSDEAFKKVQRAFEILGDPDARRAYDSSRPFDDAIPGETVTEANFYSQFAPVFERNKKWSSVPVPSLGDENTPIKMVNRFYDAWMQFHSWRDFSHEVELEEIDDSMCREEKRFYQRENERQLAALRRQEQKRVRTLVERAQKNDPRLRKIREEEEARREKERLEREAEKQRIRDEEHRRRAELAEKDRLAEEERHQKIQNERNRVKTALQKVTEFLKTNNLLDSVSTNMLLPNLVRQANISWYFGKATPEVAEAMEAVVLCESVTALPDGSVPAVLAFNKQIESREKVLGMNRYGEPIKEVKQVAPTATTTAKKAGGAAAAPATVWSDEDIILLRKAIAKFPGGTVDRWRRIVVMMRNKFTEEDVLVKTKELEAALRNATTAPKAPTASEVPSSTDVSASSAGGAPTAAAAAAAPAAAAAAAAAPTVEDWTNKQQKQLEQGLRELKDYKEKDKYQKVAAYVEGKTAKQCFERFKFLCSLNKK